MADKLSSCCTKCATEVIVNIDPDLDLVIFLKRTLLNLNKGVINELLKYTHNLLNSFTRLGTKALLSWCFTRLGTKALLSCCFINLVKNK